MHFPRAIAALTLVGIASGAPAPAPAPAPKPTSAPSPDIVLRQETSSACAEVSSLSSAASAQATDGALTPGEFSVPPSLALACLESVPVDTEKNIALLDYLLPFISFQSTLGYLKSPPKGYLLPGIDVIGGFVQMREKLKSGGYKSQFDFTTDITKIFNAAADGHFGYTPSLNSVFSFTRSLSIASVSSDGIELAKIYDVGDLQLSSSISDIVSIDDTPIAEFLAAEAARVQCQDPDAQFNLLFSSIPSTASTGGVASPGFQAAAATVPDSHKVEFANGTTKTYPNKASVNRDFTGIDSGSALHTVVELPPSTTSSGAQTSRRDESNSTTTTEAPAATSVVGYPSPRTIHKSAYISGYFLDSHPDTCVLVLYSFAPLETGSPSFNETAELYETRRVFRDFFSACAAAGRTRLIIDVSANGGGIVFQGFELYRNLFPTAKAWSGNRVRAHPATDLYGRLTYNTTPAEYQVLSAWTLDPKTNQRFPSWHDFFGPTAMTAGGRQNETAMAVYDFANPATAVLSTTEPIAHPFIVTGFDPADPAPPQPFKQDNIIVLTDGICASTCTVFTGLMQHEQNIRTVAMGGRPLKAPMQAVGGVKGSQVLQFTNMQEIQIAVLDGTNTTVVSPDLARVLPPTGPAPLQPVDLKGASFNWKNAYAEDKAGADDVPAQFLYEAANCRRFYTAEHLSDIQALWRDVADVAWNNAACAPGSSSANSEGKWTISSDAPGYTDDVVSAQKPYDGPGSLTSEAWLALGRSSGVQTADVDSTTYAIKDGDYTVGSPLPGTDGGKGAGAGTAAGGDGGKKNAAGRGLEASTGSAVAGLVAAVGMLLLL
ncbi:hypothetical protein B0T17DRAFT_370680 [Bombardia bombarda]|uniref:Tail specific protease domain-containing protein n=1 Tax=Bombardia bombarda TaxID=252184 RepID=A0AA39WGC6_9PEZI|nr:hypothetical protein B0T17DRAFT_370680 [Bombardia bombarda]